MSDKIKRDLEATRNALLNSTAKLMTDCSEPSEIVVPAKFGDGTGFLILSH